MEGDSLVINKLPGLDIQQQVVFGDISLIGTDQYTILGRPAITNAKVHLFQSYKK
jgi:hypothetical protein